TWPRRRSSSARCAISDPTTGGDPRGMKGIHPTAQVHPSARLGAGVSIGAFSIVDEHVEIGDGTSIGHHCVITGHTRIGRDNRIYHFVSLGEAPQDKKYGG